MQAKISEQIEGDKFEQICIVVRSHFKLLPTSPDWKAMTHEQILKEYQAIKWLNKDTTPKKEKDEDGNEEEEQISYEDEGFDEWDKETG